MDAPTANRIQDAYVHRTDEPIHMVLLWWGGIDTSINAVSNLTDGDGCAHFHVGYYRWNIYVYRNIHWGDQSMKIPRFAVVISSDNEWKVTRLMDGQQTQTGLIAKRKDHGGSVLIRSGMTFLQIPKMNAVLPWLFPVRKWNLIFDGDPRPMMKTKENGSETVPVRNILSPAPYDSVMFREALRSRVLTRHLERQGMDIKVIVIGILGAIAVLAVLIP